MPLLSIVVPVYNAENYLAVCIDSILNQTFTDYELILINDGSADGSADICDEYARKDERIKVIHQHNQGQASARNVGIEAAVGKYVGFCDNDDVLSPDIFSTLIDNAISANAQISACSYNEKYSDGHFSHTTHSGEMYCFTNHEGMAAYLSREKMDIYVWTKVYDKAFLDTYRIRFEAGRADEDFLFNHMAFLYAGKTIFVDRDLYTYSVRENSECRVYYKKDLKKYLHNTLYRTYKIESITKEKYPELLPLAKRQTIRYNIIMIGKIIQARYADSKPYFAYIMRYQRNNKQQVILQRNYWGMSSPGVKLMLLLPCRLYYVYRCLIERVRGMK